jgi:hypothetical protein
MPLQIFPSTEIAFFVAGLRWNICPCLFAYWELVCDKRGRGWHWGRIYRTAVQLYLLFDKKSIFHQPAPSFKDRTLGQKNTEISENRDLSRIRVLCTSDGDLHYGRS